MKNIQYFSMTNGNYLHNNVESLLIVLRNMTVILTPRIVFSDISMPSLIVLSQMSVTFKTNGQSNTLKKNEHSQCNFSFIKLI